MVVAIDRVRSAQIDLDDAMALLLSEHIAVCNKVKQLEAEIDGLKKRLGRKDNAIVTAELKIPLEVGQYWLPAWSYSHLHLRASERVERIVAIIGKGKTAVIQTTKKPCRRPCAGTFRHNRVYIGTEMPTDAEIVEIVKKACSVRLHANARSTKNVKRFLLEKELAQ
jgi:hypothetical protein